MLKIAIHALPGDGSPVCNAMAKQRLPARAAVEEEK
jgi:hypothetical protein